MQMPDLPGGYKWELIEWKTSLECRVSGHYRSALCLNLMHKHSYNIAEGEWSYKLTARHIFGEVKCDDTRGIYSISPQEIVTEEDICTMANELLNDLGPITWNPVKTLRYPSADKLMRFVNEDNDLLEFMYG